MYETRDRGNADATLRISLLGGFRVWVHDREIPTSIWRLRKARSIVKLLALSPDLSLHRAELVESLWPTFEPTAASNNLHRTLHAARRALESASKTGLESPTLRLRGQLVVLDPAGPCWIDVSAFLDAARDARGGNDIERYEQALALYSGDLLPEDRFEDWAASSRASLRAERLSLQSALADLYADRGDVVSAIDIRGEIVREDPFDEEAHVNLMRDLAHNGQRNRALVQFHELRSALREIDVEPSPDSESLYRAILSRQFPPDGTTKRGDNSAKVPNTNLPTQLTSFVGRASERRSLSDFLDPRRSNPRLVTLTGPGGSGKTRLALIVADGLSDTFGDGVFFVDLSSVVDAVQVPAAIATALGVSEVAGRPLVDVIIDALSGRSMLLVLDNCEHLVDECARFARALLLRANGVRVLATSRQPLGVHGEAIWRVSPLPVPELIGTTSESMWSTTIGELKKNPCIQLFCERAKLVRSDFTLTAENAAAVVQICRRLDGMPLAVELAAARMAAMSARSLSDRLDGALQVLSGRGQSSSDRQQTLRGTLDWSFKLLSSSEQVLFRRLAVFTGGWTIEMAEHVCADERLLNSEILNLLAQLVDKSLIQFQAGHHGERYRLLDVVHQYARERLAECGAENAVRARHADYFLSLAQTAEDALRGPDQGAWLEQLEQEYGNIRGAIEWLTRGADLTSALRLAGSIWWFCFLRGHYAEELARIIQLLDRAEAVGIDIELGVRAKALLAAGALAWKREELPLARKLLEESVSIGHRLGSTAETAWAICFLAHVTGSQGEFDVAAAYAREAADLFRVAGDLVGLARALNAMGEEARRRGDDEQAERYYQESLDFDRICGNRFGMCLRMHNLAYIALHQDRVSDAATLFLRGLQLAGDLKDLDLTAACLEGVAASEAAGGQAHRAMRLFGAAQALRTRLNVPIDIADQPEHDHYVTRAETRLTLEEAEQEWRVGLGMSLEQAISTAARASHTSDAELTTFENYRVVED